MLSRVRLLVLCCSIGAIKINVSGAQNSEFHYSRINYYWAHLGIYFFAVSITADFDRSSDIEVQESDGFAEVCVVLSGSLTSPASFRVNANSDIDATRKISSSPHPPTHPPTHIVIHTLHIMHIQLVKIL